MNECMSVPASPNERLLTSRGKGPFSFISVPQLLGGTQCSAHQMPGAPLTSGAQWTVIGLNEASAARGTWGTYSGDKTLPTHLIPCMSDRPLLFNQFSIAFHHFLYLAKH